MFVITYLLSFSPVCLLPIKRKISQLDRDPMPAIQANRLIRFERYLQIVDEPGEKMTQLLPASFYEFIR
jgi:hypothetical protein